MGKERWEANVTYILEAGNFRRGLALFDST
jgi:hypothetical protein